MFFQSAEYEKTAVDCGFTVRVGHFETHTVEAVVAALAIASA